jgi:hypothetical protein
MLGRRVLASIGAKVGTATSSVWRRLGPGIQLSQGVSRWAPSHTRDTYLAAQYRWFKGRMGTKSEGNAIFAVAHTMIVIVWHLLADNTTHSELGADYFDKCNDTASATSSENSKTRQHRHPPTSRLTEQPAASGLRPDRGSAPEPTRPRSVEYGEVSSQTG